MSSPSAARTVVLRRFAAAFTDVLLALVVGLAAYALVPAAKVNAFGAGLLVGCVYLLLRDALPYKDRGARSIGKRAFGVRPVRADGHPVDVRTSLRRNLPLAALFIGEGFLYLVSGYVGLPFAEPVEWALRALLLAEAVLVAVDPASRRLGDRWADTLVVEARYL
ncbi:MAG: RDD family protein [Rubricoccaceae bacterium]